MKHTLTKLWTSFRAAWLQRPALRRLVYASLSALPLCFALGGWQCLMLMTGYLQLVFRALLPGELVEAAPRQRAMAFLGGMARMLFFTGMTMHAAWPFILMAAAQAVCLYILCRGERMGMELSPLPLLSGSGFLVLGLLFGARVPAAQLLLIGALALTFGRLLIRQKQTVHELAMRFHTA
jgi:hypothetical protein